MVLNDVVKCVCGFVYWEDLKDDNTNLSTYLFLQDVLEKILSSVPQLFSLALTSKHRFNIAVIAIYLES